MHAKYEIIFLPMYRYGSLLRLYYYLLYSDWAQLYLDWVHVF